MDYLNSFKSSSIAWAGYDARHKILHIGYVGNDEEYEYLNVPGKKWKELQSAESKGKYVNLYIKPFHTVKKNP